MTRGIIYKEKISPVVSFVARWTLSLRTFTCYTPGWFVWLSLTETTETIAKNEH